MRTGTALLLAGLLAAGGLGGLALWLSDREPDQRQDPPKSSQSTSGSAKPVPTPTPTPTKTPPPTPTQSPSKTPTKAPAPPHELPFGGQHIYPGRTLVAYYGTAGTGSMGVLGEQSIPEMTRRLRRAAQPFVRPGRPAQIVYELIVTVADRIPGPDGDYSHDISRDKVQAFISAAHRHNALVVLDIQPGRSSFLDVAKRWRWALEDPWVGLALDPEWRMGPRQVPGRAIGHVGANEVNRVGWWLNRMTLNSDLPDKLLIVHQFTRDMVRDIQDIVDRPLLSEIQHVDGFGSRAQKMATYDQVERHPQFRMGFKLFYDEDVNLMTPALVHAIRPKVSYVSYQ